MRGVRVADEHAVQRWQLRQQRREQRGVVCIVPAAVQQQAEAVDLAAQAQPPQAQAWNASRNATLRLAQRHSSACSKGHTSSRLHTGPSQSAPYSGVTMLVPMPTLWAGSQPPLTQPLIY